jgi:acetolactate synthase-1/2/3 large subunit
MGKGVEDESSELYLGTTALSHGDSVHQALNSADLVIMVGHDITEKPPVLGHPNIAHLNFYPADIDDLYKPAIEVVGDISYALWVMSEKVKPQPHWDLGRFKQYRDQLAASLQEKIDDPGFPVKPQRFVSELRQAMPDDGILSLDNGMFKIWIARNYSARQQNTVLLDNALAAMGGGLPVGMTTRLLNPDKKVVVVAGDGGFMMNLADLETATRLKLDLVIIIINDGAYGMIKWKQQDMGLADFGLSFNNPDFIKLAESFGATGHKIEKTGDFRPTLEKAIHSKGIHIIDLPIDYSENTLVFGSKKAKGA